MKKNPLLKLESMGQSIWLDYIQRSLITSGDLKKLIDNDGLKGMTSNPSIFEKAIVESNDYDDVINSMLVLGKGLHTIYEALTQHDVGSAADEFRHLYDQTKGKDGYVSIEVNPLYAHDTQATLDEAHRLWKTLNRPNIMIKVPATREGLPAIQKLISEGINVNVTLLFGLPRYREVVEAYIAGLEARVGAGFPIKHIASVASFFISRIDVLLDPVIEKNHAEQIQGKAAIASAKMAYQIYLELFNSSRYKKLEEKGATPQRLLWASTSTKNPKYSDVKYVEALIGQNTVNTVPMETIEAYRDHGDPHAQLEIDIDDAQSVFQILEKMGINMDEVTQQLEDEGVEKFAKSYNQLIEALGKKSKENRMPAPLSTNEMIRFSARGCASDIALALEQWNVQDKIRRLWESDPTLWTDRDENKWTGWLEIVDSEQATISSIENLAKEINASDFTDMVVLGMGGSSLCPAMLAHIFGKTNERPRLHVLDSTDPLQIKHLEARIDLAHTLFIVSSKSGGTLEPNIFKQYFYARLQKVLNKPNVGSHFMGITDPGTALDAMAKKDHFRAVFHGIPSIGGRYSALSNFGMVPAGLMGINIPHFLAAAKKMAEACSPEIEAQHNPGIILGVVLGVCAKHGRDKVTLVISPRIQALGAWLEQLIAESTGKVGRGLIPIDLEPLGKPEVYGNDRTFVYIRLESDSDMNQDSAVSALEQAGHAVIRSHLHDIMQLGGELFKWEMATAVAGNILGINPFDQPDVEASKQRAIVLTEEYSKTGHLSKPVPFISSDAMDLFADAVNQHEIEQNCDGVHSIEGYLRAQLNRVNRDDYVDIAAFIEMNEAHEQLLQQTRVLIRDTKKVATCLGFGPRFLHSTGQLYKGGPNTGVFLQITAEHHDDIQIPDEKYTFGLVITAQAQADFEVLSQRGRRALRIHLKNDVKAGLQQLKEMIARALSDSSLITYSLSAFSAE